MSGSISKSKNDPGESLQMIERPLMTADELKSIPKGEFIVMKTGSHPMRTRLRLFLEWGITFGDPYILPERAAREVAYADRNTLMKSIRTKYPPPPAPPAPMPQRLPRKADRGRMRRAEPPMIELEPEEESGPSAVARYVTWPGGRP